MKKTFKFLLRENYNNSKSTTFVKKVFNFYSLLIYTYIEFSINVIYLLCSLVLRLISTFVLETSRFIIINNT